MIGVKAARGPAPASSRLSEPGETSSISPPHCIEQKSAEVSVPSKGLVTAELLHLSAWHTLMNEEGSRVCIEIKDPNKLLLRTLFMRYMVNEEIMEQVPYEGRVAYVAHRGERLGNAVGHESFGGRSTGNCDIAPSVPGLCGHITRLHCDGRLVLGDWFAAEGVAGTRVSGPALRRCEDESRKGAVIETKTAGHPVGFGLSVAETAGNNGPLIQRFLIDPPDSVTG